MEWKALEQNKRKGREEDRKGLTGRAKQGSSVQGKGGEGRGRH